MKRIFFTYREMKRRLDDFYNANQAKIDAIPVLKEIFDALFVSFNKFELSWEILTQDYSGSTLSKKNVKSQLAKHLSNCNMLVYNYCIKNEIIYELPNFRGSDVYLKRLSDEKLISRTEYSIQYLEKLGETIGETGLSAQDLEDLKTLFISYEGLAPRPKVLIGKQKIAQQDLSDAHTEGLLIIQERLDKVMESMFEDAEPDFYHTYVEASEIEKAYSSQLALKGSILDKNTKLPVPQAHIIIESIGLDHEVKGTKGGFRIKNLEPGTYTVKVEAVTYKSISLDLIHRLGETNVLEIELETVE
ncbi:carboxypeptidase-like regulatory domain-containing protein [Marinifilum sp. D737]|uniref:carboxypeptidase-like regulatory domain-containing protein n=1 Tax=Marinifilum sp. D737 TaxID=2969628 RepID=UPI002275BDE5|nr:carboxypeptidase-like regulatory domain-containing protein [Marinifilum sp. D737]MCY1634878.1 carboxypeptidase-like regulatory domain-containing protein [Marinifilum sp. D737]